VSGAHAIGFSALYLVAIAGFVGAGLGVLGVRPVRRVVGPLALAAGVCALALQFLYRQPTFGPEFF
jgi:hypothetical protein